MQASRIIRPSTKCIPSAQARQATQQYIKCPVPLNIGLPIIINNSVRFKSIIMYFAKTLAIVALAVFGVEACKSGEFSCGWWQQHPLRLLNKFTESKSARFG
ncbi:hypothetical protein LMH87_007238 [Akanthomyces muscarius]|uniref:Uncharacterized protein n=1 Tax=Akanthomyces muscarius TaxID=2231603 RepID=A0A9W8QPU7_AKAMU|nr:hypothetical protein LMH87_007238 [Akanthomyces muscarius]KAJ4165614.1 hypothetical protein LMH87_007238 [Akanthomyces muscarius]